MAMADELLFAEARLSAFLDTCPSIFGTTATPTRQDVGYIWATAYNATPSQVDQGQYYSASATLIAQSALTYLSPSYLNYFQHGPTTTSAATSQHASMVSSGITAATFVVTGTHGAQARLWSSDAPVNANGVVYSSSLHANTAGATGDNTVYTVKSATNAKTGWPTVNLALLYACETMKATSAGPYDAQLQQAFQGSQATDVATCGFPLLIYYQTQPGDALSTHTSDVLGFLNGGGTIDNAIKDANSNKPPVTVSSLPNPMIVQGDTNTTARYVYLSAADIEAMNQLGRSLLTWYIVERNNVIQ